MENRGIPAAGELYRHFKDKLYQIVAVAAHSETGERLVIYQALYGDFGVYARPLDMFLSEVDHKKYPEVTQRYRFEKVERAELGTEKDGVRGEMIQKVLPAANQSGAEEQSVLLLFLDAETYAEKLNILKEKKKNIDDKMADDMAASLDVVLREAPLAEKLRDLENCLKTYVKFECSRLR